MLATELQIMPPRELATQTFTVYAKCRPFSVESRNIEMPVGATVRDVLGQMGFYDARGCMAWVTLNESPVHPDLWAIVKPKAGTRLMVNVLPMGGGGGGGGTKKSTSQILRHVGINLAAVTLGAFFPAAVPLLAVGAMVVNTMLDMALASKAPPPPQGQFDQLSGTNAKTSQTLYIRGGRNQTSPYGVVPRVYGVHRITPPYGAQPFTEIKKGDQILRMLFVIGKGPYALQNMRIGQTAIEQFDDFDIEINHGFETDKEHKLYPSSVFSQQFSVIVKEENDDLIRTAGANADELCVEIDFLRGLVSIDPTSGEDKNRTVEYRIDYRPSTGGDWKKAFKGEKKAKTRQALRFAHKWSVPRLSGDETYDVRVLRLTDDAPDPDPEEPTILDEMYWVNLQTFTNSAPLNLPGLCTVALRIRATDQLNGQIDAFNCEALSLFDNAEAAFDLLFNGSGTRAQSDARKFNVTGDDSRTIEAWFKARSAGEGDQGGLWQAGKTGDEDGDDFSFRVKTSVDDDNWRLEFWHKSIDIVLPDSLDGNWHHVAVVYDKAADRIRIVYDGTQVYNAAPPITPGTDEHEFIVGAWVQGTRNWNFDGWIRDVRVWDIARSSGDIGDDMNSVLDGDETGLIAWYPISEGSGAVLFDMSGHANHLYVHNDIEWSESDRDPVPVPSFSNNPAVIFKDILTGTSNGHPIDEAKLDTATLATWAAFCATKGFAFNMSIDFPTTVAALLRMVCAAGRAGFSVRDTLYSVIIDDTISLPTQHFTPRNSWGFRATRAFIEMPHALRARFIDEANDYQANERIVYDDGYSADGAGDTDPASRFETIEFQGVTSAEAIYRFGRFHLAVGRLRPRQFELNADVENIPCQRGDLVRVTHDVPLIGQNAGRITSLFMIGSDCVAFRMDQEITMEEGNSYVAHVRKQDGTMSDLMLVTNPGTWNVVKLETPTAAAIAEGDLVAFGEFEASYREFLVQEVHPTSDLSARLVLIDYSPAVFEADEGEIPDFDSGGTIPPQVRFGPPIPRIWSVVTDESVLLVQADGSLVIQASIAFTFDEAREDTVERIEARYRLSNLPDQPWTNGPIEPLQSSRQYILQNLAQGHNYNIQLRAIGRLGSVSEWSTAYGVYVIGKETPPPAATDLDAFTISTGEKQISWTLPDPMPVDFWGVLLRFGRGHDLAWEDLSPLNLEPLTSGPYKTFGIPNGEITLGIKTIDTSGNLSAAAYTENFTFGVDDSALFFINQDMKKEGWPGFGPFNPAGTIINDDNEIEVVTDGTWEDPPTWDDWDTWGGGSTDTGFEYLSPIIDLGSAAQIRIEAFMAGYGQLFLTAYISEDGVSFVGQEIARTDGALTGSLVGTLVPLTPRRYVRIGALSSSSPSFVGDPNLLKVSEFAFSIHNYPIKQIYEGIDTSDAGDVTVLGTGNFRLPLTKPFKAINSVGINFVGGGSGWTFEVIDYDDDDGPEIKIYKDGVLTDTTINAEVRGL